MTNTSKAVVAASQNLASKIADFTNEKVYGSEIKNKFKPEKRHSRDEVSGWSVDPRQSLKVEQWEEELIKSSRDCQIEPSFLSIHSSLKYEKASKSDFQKLVDYAISSKSNSLLKKLLSDRKICLSVFEKKDIFDPYLPEGNSIGANYLSRAISANNIVAIDILFEKAKEGYFNIASSNQSGYTIFGDSILLAGSKEGLETFKHVVEKIDQLHHSEIKALSEGAKNDQLWSKIIDLLGVNQRFIEYQLGSTEYDEKGNYFEAIKSFCESRLSEYLNFNSKKVSDYGTLQEWNGTDYREKLCRKFLQEYDMSNPEEKTAFFYYKERLKHEDEAKPKSQLLKNIGNKVRSLLPGS